MTRTLDVSATCELWILCGLPPPEEIDRLLTARERDRRDGYRRPPDARRYATGVALARLAVARFALVPPADVRFRRVCSRCDDNRHGKPHAVDLPVHHSVSHAGEVVAVAVTGVAPIGLDVEECLPLDGADGLLAAVRGRGEPPVTGPRDFCRRWSRKEAVVKATGDGLSVPLAEVVLAAGGAVISYQGRRLDAEIRDIEVGPGYVGALAVLHTGRVEVVVRDGADLLRPAPVRPAR